MATVNIPALAIIAPAAQRTPAPQQAAQNGQPSFSQVLKSRNQAPEAPKPSTKTEGARDKTEARPASPATPDAEAAAAAAETLAFQTETPIDPALLLAAVGINPTTAATNVPVPADTERDGTQLDASLLAASTTGLAAQAANLAGKTSPESNALQNQAGSSSSAPLPGEADGKPLSSQINAESETRPSLLKTATDKLTASTSEEKPTAFATELANANQNLEASTNQQTTHGVLNGAQTGRTGEVLPRHEISTPVATQGWAEEVGQKVSWIASRDNGRAEIVLTPPSMGRVEVSIKMNGDQASATFITASPAAREALQDAMPRLREVLAQSGIQLGQADVNQGTPQQQAQTDNPARRSASSRFTSSADTGMAPVGATSAGWTSRGNSMIDTFA